MDNKELDPEASSWKPNSIEIKKEDKEPNISRKKKRQFLKKKLKSRRQPKT